MYRFDDIQTSSIATLERMWRAVCAEDASSVSTSDMNAARRGSQHLFGSGGGGATTLWVDGALVAVAGGGGGVFPRIFAAADSSSINSAGGNLMNASTINITMPSSRQDEHAAGDGISMARDETRSPTEYLECADCTIMSGHFHIDGSSSSLEQPRVVVAGRCPSSRSWNVSGGAGGGGASCGPAAGGGGGFVGGVASARSNGGGGSSAVLWPSVRVAAARGLQRGDGAFVLQRCVLQCPINASCEFEEAPQIGESPHAICRCARRDGETNGRITSEGGSCEQHGIVGE